MNKPLWGTIALLVLALAAGGGYWIGQRQAPAPMAAAPAGPGAKGAAVGPGGPGATGGGVTVEAIKVTTASLPQSITTVGSLRSDESVTVRPEVAGRISFIGFKEGQPVGKGTVLIRLDSSVNEAELQQARANLVLAKSKYERAVDLAKSNFISGQARDEAENNYKVAQAAMQLVEARLAKTEIRAPFSGVIGLRQVSIGDYVKEGADLVNLESIDPLKVDFRVPEVYLKLIKVGQVLQVVLDAQPSKVFEGRVYAINPLVDAAGRSIVIRAQVGNVGTTLRPGMFARVRLITDQRQDALIVPEQALVPQGTEQFVFRVLDGRAQRVKVEIGQRADGKVEILQGVAAGDLVVTAGQLKLRDGVPVVVARPEGADAAAAQQGANGGGTAPAAPEKAAAPAGATRS